jgi:predicted YcjX-like family ATPase
VAEFIEEIRLAARALAEFGVHLFNPTIRLGVTGLSRAGKTVFITALFTAWSAADAFRFSRR